MFAAKTTKERKSRIFFLNHGRITTRGHDCPYFIRQVDIMGKFEVLDHPLIQHKLTIIRKRIAERANFDRSSMKLQR